jgi:divalent metal cation (Fe/Co/Zn/Cd) transporter
MASQPRTQSSRHGVLAVRADAWAVAARSVAWTLASGSAAIVLGFAQQAVVLVAFGAVSLFDALGSAALTHHVRLGLRQETLSGRLEQRARRIVVARLLCVGCAAVVAGIVRLANDQRSESSASGTALAAASVAVLVALARRKASLAARVSSRALRGDIYLSAVGATQAAVTLLGALTTMEGWHWADPAAAMVVARDAADRNHDRAAGGVPPRARVSHP